MDKIEDIFAMSSESLANLSSTFDREEENTVDWTQKLVGLKGARGVGKTTVLLKYLKNTYGDNPAKAVYVSMDHLYFMNNNLLGFAREFYRNGGEHIFLDEVHKYGNWSQELKNIYDGIPKLKVSFTSSSLLNILKGKADLSRRADIYHLHGLSFREFLQIETGEFLPVIPLEDILKHHEKIAADINKKLRPYAHWTNYLEYGYYPFFLQSKERYAHRLMNVINQSLDSDLVACKPVDATYINKLKRLLYLVAVSSPFQPNVAKLAGIIGASRQTTTQYFDYLAEAELALLLKSEEKSINALSKPDKVYLHNTNLAYAIARSGVNTGNRRETFFFNQVAAKHAVNTPKQGDFLVDSKYTFEIGGKGKSFRQIKNSKNSYLVSDDIDIGFGNRSPLFLFGFLY